MMENPRPEVKNIIKDITNLFRLWKKLHYTASNDIRNCDNNYIEYESNSDRNKTLSLEEYFNKIRPYLKDINDLRKAEMWKIQLTIADNFISSIDNDQECVMHSKSDNREIIINDEADEVIK